ncbi:unnamed protein product, partial [Closterium sp. NIES-54]
MPPIIHAGALSKGNGGGGGKGKGSATASKGAGKGKGGKLLGFLGGRTRVLGSVQAKLQGKSVVDDMGASAGAPNAIGTLALVSL